MSRPSPDTCPHDADYDHSATPLRELADGAPACLFRELDRRQRQYELWQQEQRGLWDAVHHVPATETRHQ